jgi:CO/xanthine dehydrogenase Mo-binding subunit
VQGAPTWIGDVKVPGMLHARVVHPPSLGSTLIQVGRLDPAAHPTAQIVERGSLVGVVAETEWEAIRAAEALAQNTEWRDWNGLPGSDSLIAAMVEMDWSDGPTSTTSPDQEAMEAAFSSAPTKLSATYALPYYKHAPIGPEITVADVPSDGSIRIWTSTQRPQTLRTKIAAMLETEPTNVVVRFVEGAASFGRTNRGDGGAEAEAVLISQACGRPVRLQWSHEDDFGWAKQQAPYLGEVSVGLDEKGRMATFRAEHYLLGANDTRMLGALLAGTPAPLKPSFISELCVEWPYDRVLGHLELGHSTTNLGQRGSPLSVGLQHQSMRSPQHLQQNFGVECMVSEAAAAAGADPIQYRIDHTTDSRLISVLEGVRDMSGWKSRPSPASSARDSGGGVVRGRGVGVAIRKGGYLAAVAEISVDLGTGAICVDRYWLAADVGVVVNPRLLLLNLEGGSAFGISQALREELKFDSRSITSRDFRSYPILTMAEMPELEVKILPPGDTMTAGEASEPANMVPLVALAGAFFDATGKTMRRLPMRPEYVLAELRGS